MAMKRIEILRETIAKVTRTLAAHEIKVTQSGLNAFVEYHPESGKPMRVNVPLLPDNASEQLILAVQGFIDHEVGHLLESDFEAIKKAHEMGIASLHNICEDTYVEKKMRQRYRGADANLSNVARFLLEKMMDDRINKAIASEKDEMSLFMEDLAMPAIRAWAGQEVFKDYMEDKWQHIEGIKKKIGLKIIFDLQKVDSSWDALDVADRLRKYLTGEEKPEDADESGEGGESGEGSDPSPSGKGGKGSGKGKKTDNKPEAGESGGSDSSEGGEDEKDPADAEKGGEESDPKDDERSDEEGDSESGSGEDSDSDEEGDSDDTGEDADSDDSDSDDTGEDGDDGDSGDDSTGDSDSDGSEGEGEDGGDDKEDRTGETIEKDDPSDMSTGEDPNDSVGGSGSEERNAMNASMDELNPEDEFSQDGLGSDEEALREPTGAEFEAMKEFEDYLNEYIEDATLDAVSDTEYMPHSVENDITEKLVPNKGWVERYGSDSVAKLMNKVDHLIGPLAKDLERYIAAQSRSFFVPGFRSGRLHNSNLFKLKTGDTRVFRRKEEHTSKDVAVQLVVDCSGSMSGHKIRVAQQCAYGLSSALDRIGITNEVIGFTTGHDYSTREMEEATREVMSGLRKKGKGSSKFPGFGRLEPLYHPVFKDFGERFTPDVRKRMAFMGEGLDLRNNVDGESVAAAYKRLAARSEAGKIMIVISDGSPACYYGRGLDQHLHKVVKEIEADGCDVIGIGVEDRSVKRFYKNHIIINNVDDLPKTIMKALKKLIAKNSH